MARDRQAPCCPRAWARMYALDRDLGGLCLTLQAVLTRSRKERRQSESEDEQGKAVGCSHNTVECGEQRGAGLGGVERGKGCNQGESAKPKHVPYTETGKRVTGGGADTAGCIYGLPSQPEVGAVALARTYGSVRGEHGNMLPYRDERIRQCFWIQEHPKVHENRSQRNCLAMYAIALFQLNWHVSATERKNTVHLIEFVGGH